MENKNQELTNLLEEHAKTQSDVTLNRILELLPQTDLFVPGIDARTKDTFVAIHQENLLQKLDMPVLPDMLKGEDGRGFYPAFTEKTLAPEIYQEKAEWVQLSCEELCDFAIHSEICHEIILNPFTTPLVMPETLVLEFAGQYKPEEK